MFKVDTYGPDSIFSTPSTGLHSDVLNITGTVEDYNDGQSVSGINTSYMQIQVKNTIVYTSGIETALESQLQKPVTLEAAITDDIVNHSMVVYDFNTLKIRNVIEDMKKKSEQEYIVFRLLPKNSKFILGSDSAISRGELLRF
jgi:hypothetical protein